MGLKSDTSDPTRLTLQLRPRALGRKDPRLEPRHHYTKFTGAPDTVHMAFTSLRTIPAAVGVEQDIAIDRPSHLAVV